MIKSVLLPECFILDESITPPSDNPTTRMLTVLWEFQKAGLVVLDEDGKIISSIHSAVRTWPQQPRTEALKILTTLWKRKQIISRKFSPENFDPLCDISRAVETQDGFVSVITDTNCTCDKGPTCLRCHHPWQLNFQIRAREAIDNLSYRHPSGKFTKEQFERDWLAERLKYTRKVRIIDPLIGRTATQNGQPYQIHRGFDTGVKWLIDCFFRHSISPKEMVIYTHIRDFLSANDRQNVKTIMKQWETDLQSIDARAAGKVRVDTRYSYNRTPLALEHDRYLITDQFTISMTRGFDLLQTDKCRLNDGTAITLKYEDRHEIQQQFQNAPLL